MGLLLVAAGGERTELNCAVVLLSEELARDVSTDEGDEMLLCAPRCRSTLAFEAVRTGVELLPPPPDADADAYVEATGREESVALELKRATGFGFTEATATAPEELLEELDELIATLPPESAAAEKRALGIGDDCA